MEFALTIGSIFAMGRMMFSGSVCVILVLYLCFEPVAKGVLSRWSNGRGRRRYWMAKVRAVEL